MEISLAEKITLNFALTVPEASALSRVCRSKLYEAMGSGALRAKKRGKTTLILPADLRSWIDSLPDFKSGVAAPKPKPKPPRRLMVAAE